MNLDEMKKLVDELNIHCHNYYVLDNPTIADADYDKFEAYANAIFDKVSAGVSSTEEA